MDDALEARNRARVTRHDARPSSDLRPVPRPEDEVTERVVLLRGVDAANTFACTSIARSFGLRSGLSPLRAEELALVASEIGSRARVQREHASLEIRHVRTPRPHVLVVYRDRVPVGDRRTLVPPGEARDATGTASSVARIERAGADLRWIAPLVDVLRVETLSDFGTTVIAEKWLR